MDSLSDPRYNNAMIQTIFKLKAFKGGFFMLTLILVVIILSCVGGIFRRPFGYRRYHGLFGRGFWFRPPMGGMHDHHMGGPMGGMHHMGGPMGGGHGFGGGMGHGGPGGPGRH